VLKEAVGRYLNYSTPAANESATAS
jgi:hypothetical protein